MATWEFKSKASKGVSLPVHMGLPFRLLLWSKVQCLMAVELCLLFLLLNTFSLLESDSVT